MWPIAASSGPYTCCGHRLITLLLVRCETRAGICPAVSVHCTPWLDSQCMKRYTAGFLSFDSDAGAAMTWPLIQACGVFPYFGMKLAFLSTLGCAANHE